MAALIARLQRSPSTDQGTFGRLAFGGHVLHTTELPWRNNTRQRSCIPPGAYACALVNSPKFGRVYGVANVPGRSHVLIHAANLGGDVDQGWLTQLHGCIAPAERLGAMRIPATTTHPARMQRAGLISRPALATLMAWAGGQPFTLEITEP
jgi:hypothetical protein